ncbi:DUF2778 domain-containing protein [Ancylobacter sp. A5.8]|uniref:DUF2778 domain-containing protein n=1 Tax=Ancylobacter gelatini TaxID=2919920 RepID=UPI001F4E07B2|nr:DUF2778 domain-containing protein [Ancylobacter gelatini]MCJ8142504.1 DUF2778 domain-containing protein [Ancylobacter gelatini]
MAEKARISTAKASSEAPVRQWHGLRARSLAHVVGVGVIGFCGVAAVAVAAAWGAGWGADPVGQPALRPILSEPMKMTPEPFAIAPPVPVRTVMDVRNFHSSGLIALAPNWLFDPALQEPRPTAHEAPVASLPTTDNVADAGTTPEPVVETATTIPLPVANPLFAGRLQAPDTPDADAAVAQSAEQTRTQLALAPLPPRNPLLSVEQATAGPLPEDEAPDAAPTLPDTPPPEAMRPELTYPGPEDRFALYDIKAKKVYLPGGKKLEAHSGYGDKMDNIRHVSVKMYGPTPPNIYKLTWREKLFHGSRAVRMTPIGKGEMYGRNGFLVHPYLLGPRGDSNGCVSIDDYDTFMTTFEQGKIDRIIVVESMPKGDEPMNPLIAWLTGRSREK